MRFKFTATVVCDHEEGTYGCTEVAKFEADPEGYTIEEFGGAAKAEFRRLGWRCCEPAPRDKCLCPTHNPDNSVVAQAAKDLRDDYIYRPR